MVLNFLEKTRILRCSTLVNPSVLHRFKQRGMSSVGNTNDRPLLTEYDQNRVITSKINHLLEFDEGKLVRSGSQARKGVRRIMT